MDEAKGAELVAAPAPPPRPRGLRRQARDASATRAAGRRSASGANADDAARRARPGSPARGPPRLRARRRAPDRPRGRGARRACRCSPSAGCSPARSTSAGCATGERAHWAPVVDAGAVGDRPGGRAPRAATRDGRPPGPPAYALTDAPLRGLRPPPDRRHRPLPAPGRLRGVHRGPARAAEAPPRPAQGHARARATARDEYEAIVREVLGRRVARRRPHRRGRRRGAADAEPDRAGARPHRARARRRPGALPARPRPAGPRGDDGRASTSRRPRRSAARPAHGARRRPRSSRYLRDLPRLWDDAPGSRRGARRGAVRAGRGPGAAPDARSSRRRQRSPRASWRRFRAHLLVMVGARGFEPPTSSSRTMRATKLRHAPTEVLVVQSPGIVTRGDPPRQRGGRARRRRASHVAATLRGTSLPWSFRSSGIAGQRARRPLISRG